MDYPQICPQICPQESVHTQEPRTPASVLLMSTRLQDRMEMRTFFLRESVFREPRRVKPAGLTLWAGRRPSIAPCLPSPCAKTGNARLRPERGRLPKEGAKEETPGKGSGAQGCLPAAGARLARLPSTDDTSGARGCTAFRRPDTCIVRADPERDEPTGRVPRRLRPVGSAFILSRRAWPGGVAASCARRVRREALS